MDEVASFFKDKGVAITKDALDYISSQPDPLNYCEKVLKENQDKKFLTLEDVVIKDVGIEPTKEEPVVDVFFPSEFKPIAKDIEADVKVFDEYDVTGKSESSGDMDDFIEYFRDRFERLSRILRKRMPVVRDIMSLKKASPSDYAIVIGMVVEKRLSRAGHFLIRIDDPTDELTVLVPKDKRDCMAKASTILPDEVIAVEGRFSNSNLFIVSDILQPDIPPREPKVASEDVALAMISDTHVGSKLFLEKVFLKFIDWINGKGPKKDLAGKVKYLTIAGDLVDGVGVYPGQEDELNILDIYEQYSAFQSLLENVPDYIEIIIIPGNHDIVRVADPQPAIPKDLLSDLYNFGNVHLIGSPGYVSLHGVEVLMYHGQSIHSYVPHLSGFDYSKPERLGEEVLKRRHLHIVYGEKPPLNPEKRDFLVIERVPDIMHFGDVHKNGYTQYKGVTIVNSGTWQDITPYQIKQGHHPTPGVLPVMNLANRRLSVLRFRRENIGV